MKTIAYIIAYVFYPLSFLFVRNRNKASFGSFRKSFNDNAKYLFIYFQKNRNDVDSAWLSLSRRTVDEIRSMGMKAYFTLSPKGVWHALTSKYWFYNSYSSDIMYGLSGGAVCVNLWHGLALKSIEFNIKSGALADRYKNMTFKERFYHPESFKRPDWVLSSTDFQSVMFASAFRISQSHCLEMGYPRNSILTCTETDRNEHMSLFESEDVKSIVSKIEEGHYSKVFIYMPTWRDSQREIFIQSFDLSVMNEILMEKNSLLLLKPHANTVVDRNEIENFSNILLVDGKTDVYPLLPITDVLVTDYSSVLYDYVLMDKKDVILYLYDYKDYVNDRELFYPFDVNVVGTRVYDFEQLCSCIESDDFAMNLDKKKDIVERFWGPTSKIDSSKSISDFFFGDKQMF